MENKKSIIIAGVVLIIVIASLFTVFKFSRDKVLKNPFVGGVGQPKMSVSEAPGMSIEIMPEEDLVERSSSFAPQGEFQGLDMAMVNDQERKISQNGSLSGETGDVNWALGKISEIAKKQGGYLLSSNIYENDQEKKYAMATVQVPSENFENTFSEIKGSFRVNQESTYQNDVTREYQDLEVRIENKKAEEKAFAEILTEAESTEDVISITRELSRVRTEIERLETQKRYFDNMVDMSMINIDLVEEEEIFVDSTWRPIQVVKETINSLIKDIQKSINFVIVLFIRIIPIVVGYIVVALIIYWIVKFIYAKVKDRKERSKKL